jgi:hypothetical protein
MIGKREMQAHAADGSDGKVRAWVADDHRSSGFSRG